MRCIYSSTELFIFQFGLLLDAVKLSRSFVACRKPSSFERVHHLGFLSCSKSTKQAMYNQAHVSRIYQCESYILLKASRVFCCTSHFQLAKEPVSCFSWLCPLATLRFSGPSTNRFHSQFRSLQIVLISTWRKMDLQFEFWFATDRNQCCSGSQTRFAIRNKALYGTYYFVARRKFVSILQVDYSIRNKTRFLLRRATNPHDRWATQGILVV